MWVVLPGFIPKHVFLSFLNSMIEHSHSWIGGWALKAASSTIGKTGELVVIWNSSPGQNLGAHGQGVLPANHGPMILRIPQLRPMAAQEQNMHPNFRFKSPQVPLSSN
jgi:hypothetical protein